MYKYRIREELVNPYQDAHKYFVVYERRALFFWHKLTWFDNFDLAYDYVQRHAKLNGRKFIVKEWKYYA